MRLLRLFAVPKCLASPHWATASGTQLVIWDCAIATNQQWYGSAMEG